MRWTQVWRRLVQQRLFTAVTVLTLGIGIGANSAIFAVVDHILLEPLPFPHADRLVEVNHRAPGVNQLKADSSPFLYFTYREDAKSFEDIGLWTRSTASLTGLAEPEEIRTMEVTDGVLPLLGVPPVLGRPFSRQDDLPGSPETVMLTYGYWQSKFGGDATVIGRRLMLDGRPREVIGVLPSAFQFLDQKPAALLPLRLDRSKTFLGNFSYRAVARLKPGVTAASAQADTERLVPVAIHRFPAFPGYSVKMFEEARLSPTIEPLKQTLVGDISSVLWVLMGTVGLVLLMACANVANLLLVRAEGRQHELAIRAAIGASRWQIARELLVESLTLGAIGGVLGLALAGGGLRLLRALSPGNLPRVEEVAIDGSVLLFTLLVSLATGVLFGLFPIAKYVGSRAGLALRAGGRTQSQSRERHRARNTLVGVQVSLEFVLLIGSGLMIRTFRALSHVNPGFSRPEEVQTLRIFIPETTVKEPEAVVRLEQTIVDKLTAIPGVTSVGLSNNVPMDGRGWNDPLFAEDHVYTEGQLPPLRFYRFISPGLLKTMGNSIVAGRDFTWADVYEKRPVLMVSENLARELWHDPARAIGKRVRENTKAPWREVIGVVSDEHDEGVQEKPPTVAFWPILMTNFEGDDTAVRRMLAYVIRTPRAGSHDLLGQISQAVWSVNPNLPLANVSTLKEVYDQSLARTSFALVMLAIAGAMALLLGIAGVYGVISYSVSQRTREIGIRRALGAQNRELTGMFILHGARLAAVGIVCGGVAAIALVRLMSSMLFGVSPLDPPTYLGVAAGLATAAILASYVPAVRALGVDPVHALKTE